MKIRWVFTLALVLWNLKSYSGNRDVTRGTSKKDEDHIAPYSIHSDTLDANTTDLGNETNPGNGTMLPLTIILGASIPGGCIIILVFICTTGICCRARKRTRSNMSMLQLSNDYHVFAALENTTTTITNSDRPVPPPNLRGNVQKTKPPALPPKPRAEFPSDGDTHLKPSPRLGIEFPSDGDAHSKPKRAPSPKLGIEFPDLHSKPKRTPSPKLRIGSPSDGDVHSKPKKLPLLPTTRKAHTFEKAPENSSDRRETVFRSASSPADVQTIEKFRNRSQIVAEQQSAEVEIYTNLGAHDHNDASGYDTTPMTDRHESNSTEDSVEVNYTEPLVVNWSIPVSSNIAYNGSTISKAHFPSQLSNSADNSELFSSSADSLALPDHSYDEPHTFW